MKENIFSNFYTKVLNFFTARNEEDSARSTASNRLKLVLMQDRSNLDGATMQKMREQLISVISKYIEIDTEALDLNLEGDGEEIALMLNIPVIRARTMEEIEEIEAQEEAEKQEALKKAIEEQEETKKDEEDKSEEELESDGTNSDEGDTNNAEADEIGENDSEES